MEKSQSEKEEKIEEKDKIIEEKENIIKEKEELIQDYLNQMKKMQADFINFKNRVEKEREKFIKQSNRELIQNLLEILDNLERAVDNGDEGINLIYKQFKDILEKEGLEEIDTEGKFDPYYHEAVAVENSDCENGKITAVLQRGYLLNNKVLRHAKVKICKR
ncbi:MAG: nucleotide exchange factor GrpE [Euryarchaeota archaeon]|nr:nucleotide exchange factor GrpE [Euryarchaeota archaeon]